MSWTMNVNPLGNLALSALVAFVPILFLFTALTVLKMKGHWAAIIATCIISYFTWKFIESPMIALGNMIASKFSMRPTPNPLPLANP